MDGRDQVSLLNDEKNRLDGGKTATDWNLYYDLIGKTKTEAGRVELQKTLPQYFDRLAPQQRNDMIARIEMKPGSADDLDVLTFDKQIESVTPGWKPDKREPFRVAAGTAVAAESARLGRKLNQAERKQIIDEMLLEGEVKRGGVFDPDRQYYEVVDTEDEAKFVPDEYENIPKEDRRLIVEALQSAGRATTPMAVTALWNASKKR
jgi:hypothetical protein